jgi:putative transcription factor
MDHQDWTVITLKKKKKTNKKSQNVGGTVTKNTPPNKQNKSNFSASRIEEKMDNDEYHLPSVSHSLQMQIQQARQAKNMTQKDLAQKANISESIVKSYESGKAIPTQADLNKLRKVLGVKLKNK